METPEQCVKSLQDWQLRQNNIDVIDIILGHYCYLLKKSTYFFGVSTVDFKQVNAGWIKYGIH